MYNFTWLYDAMIYMYALSLLFLFSDFVSANPRTRRIGAGLLAFVWLLHTLLMIARLYMFHYVAFFSMHGSLFFFSWLIVTSALILSFLYRIDLPVFLVALTGLIVIAMHFFSDPSTSPTLDHWRIDDELLFVHISFAIFSYVAYLTSALFAGLYLFLHRKLKEKQWSAAMRRVPSLEFIESFTYKAAVVGTPLLIVSLGLGVAWIVLTGKWDLLYDAKVISSVIMIAMYASYLFSRFRLKTAAHRLALVNLAAFAFVLFNFMFANFLSRFH